LAPRTGELIVARGIASAEQVERAQREGKARGEPLCSRLLAAGIDEHELVSVLAEKHGVPGVDLSRTAIPLDLVDLVPRAVAEGDLILPVSREGDRIHLAVARPMDDRVIAEVRFVTGHEVSPYVALRASLLRSIGEAYEARARGAPLWRGHSCASGEAHLAAVVPGAAEQPPAAAEPLPEEVEIEIVPDAAAHPPAAAHPTPLVLVVDDEPEIRTLVERALAANGYAVALAADGAEALEKAERLVPDLVLLDAMLPKVHGFDACRRIKASARTRDVPVVMMTAIYRGWRFAQDARDSYGAVDYVEKPFRLEDLLRRIADALLSGAAHGGARAQPEEDAAPLVAKGKALLADGHVPEAVEALEEAVRADPASAAAQLHLGRALRAAGDPFGAMTALERASDLRPDHLGALRALAAVYEETGFRRKAAEVLERAIPAAPDDAARAAIRKDLIRLIA
jgi:DNA-binding response OmpR family regulator